MLSDGSIDTAQRMRAAGLVLAVREGSTEDAARAVRRAMECGPGFIEITLTTPGALDIIASLRESHPQVQVGAGTVTSATLAAAATSAGADFLVAPTLSKDVVAWASEHQRLLIPGVFSPSEAHSAWKLGCPILKLFPASVLGTEYLKAVLAPMPDLQFLVSGGVTTSTARGWVAAGAAAVSISVRANPGDGAALTNDLEPDEEMCQLRAVLARAP